jgi:hypothetical protein
VVGLAVLAERPIGEPVTKDAAADLIRKLEAHRDQIATARATSAR